MKKMALILALVCTAVAAWAVPALSVWRTVVQSDSTTLRVMQVGDERMHYYITTDRVPLVEQPNGDFCYASALGFGLSSTGVVAHEAARRTSVELAAMTTEDAVRALRRPMPGFSAPHRSLSKAPARADAAVDSTMMGRRRALLLLVDFSNLTFKSDSTAIDYYTAVCNQEGYTNDYGAIGSVHDYFAAQSLGKFDLTFDVVKVTLPKENTWYGANGSSSSIYGNGDQYDRLAEMVISACEQADTTAQLDWTRYDWNGDGTAELVFLLYAGGGEATGGGDATVWPHMFSLSDITAYEQYYKQNAPTYAFTSHDSIAVNIYACSNEVYGRSANTRRMGLGVICHEFSHCMGLPDLYDTGGGNASNLGDYDVLASGSYNSPTFGLGWVPAGYTAYERRSMNWIDYVVLDSTRANDTIRNLRPMSDGGDSYVLYNAGHPAEYFIVENRVQQGWDTYIPDQGLMMMHIDYDPYYWEYNEVNSLNGDSENKHARVAFLASNNSRYSPSYVFPYGELDSITDLSAIPPTLYNNNVDSTTRLGLPIYDITFDLNTGLASFVFLPIAQADTTDTTLTAISQVAMPRQTAAVYTLDGHRLSAAQATSLKPGIYVVRFADGRTRKVLVE